VRIYSAAVLGDTKLFSENCSLVLMDCRELDSQNFHTGASANSIFICIFILADNSMSPDTKFLISFQSGFHN